MEQSVVLAAAVSLAVLLVLAAYFSDRLGGVDEIGLYNPPYMALHYGKMSYPVHGFFKNMVVHPPVHYQAIAAFMRMGMTIYYAEATPALLMLLFCIWLIVRGPFSAAVKIGLLSGIWVSVAVYQGAVEMFGLRPENHLGAAWLAGLVSLESARLKRWNLKLLCVGAFLLTYASGVHYYAAAGVLGVIVYMVWAVHEIGPRRAAKPLLAMIVGGLLFGVPYLVLFVVPERNDIIEMIRGTQSGGSLLANVRAHVAEYHTAWRNGVGNYWLRILFWSGIPAVLLSTPILFVLRQTRGIALAALPLQLFILLFAWHKHAYYYTHEAALYTAAIVAGALTAAGKFIPRMPWRPARYASRACVAGLVAFGWWQLDKWAGTPGPTLTLQPRVHEMEIARAASQEMVGADARVASRIGLWYASGGRHWHDCARDLIWVDSVSKVNLPAYFARFDAVAEGAHMSNTVANREQQGLLSWYLDGTLQLKGFFFAESNSELSYLLFQVARSSPLTGFALKHGKLYRFEENASGDHEFQVMTVPLIPGLYEYYEKVQFAHLMYVPGSDARQLLWMALRRSTGQAMHDAPVRRGRLVLRSRGNLVPADRELLMLRLRQGDLPMRFYADIRSVPSSRDTAPSPGETVR